LRTTVRARYRATREEIAARYAEGEAIGDPEIRGDDPVRMFNPALPMFVRDTKIADAPDMRPVIDACERFLFAVFLRRYVTWCARRRRFAAMEAAARLLQSETK